MDKKTYLSIMAALATAVAIWLFALGIYGLIVGPVLFAILITVWRDVMGVGPVQEQA